VNAKIYIKMPKTPLYCNSVIYKLCCKDPSILDIYVGSTTNFTNRKRQHKDTCNNENSIYYTQYKYQFIRDNCGWNNWDMIKIKDYPTDSKRNLEMEERRIIEELKPTLNKQLPTRTNKEYKENNKESISLKRKEWDKKNIEKIKQKVKEWRENNKDRYYETQSQKITCSICGSILLKRGLNRHQRTKKCITHQ